MKKIERLLHDAFWRGLRKKANNTRIMVDGERVSLELFGNTIARRQLTSSAIRFTLAGWNTLTTRSRLRSVCELNQLCQRGKRPYYGSQPLETKDWYLVPERGAQCRRITEQD